MARGVSTNPPNELAGEEGKTPPPGFPGYRVQLLPRVQHVRYHDDSFSWPCERDEDGCSWRACRVSGEEWRRSPLRLDLPDGTHGSPGRNPTSPPSETWFVVKIANYDSQGGRLSKKNSHRCPRGGHTEKATVESASSK